MKPPEHGWDVGRHANRIQWCSATESLFRLVAPSLPILVCTGEHRHLPKSTVDSWLIHPGTRGPIGASSRDTLS